MLLFKLFIYVHTLQVMKEQLDCLKQYKVCMFLTSGKQSLINKVNVSSL